MPGQPGVGRAEMSAADKATVRTEWLGMGRGQYTVAIAVYRRTLALGITAPEHEHNATAFAVDQFHHAVGKGLPALALM